MLACMADRIKQISVTEQMAGLGPAGLLPFYQIIDACMACWTGPCVKTVVSVDHHLLHALLRGYHVVLSST